MRTIKARCERNPVDGALPSDTWVAWTEGASRHVLFGPTKGAAQAALRRRIYDVLGSKYKVTFQKERAA